MAGKYLSKVLFVLSKNIHQIFSCTGLIKKSHKWKEAGTFVPARMKKKNIL